MKISIFGLGYVGCVSAACCAKLGHTVIGVDVSENKVMLMNAGRPTIIEAGIEELVMEGRNSKRLSATQDVKYAVQCSDISFITVGTPSTPEGHLNLNYVYNVAKQIGEALISKNSFHIIIIRSTVLPGTNKKVGEIIEDTSGKIRGKDFAVVSNPEFLREGTAIHDYLNPPLTLVGCDNIQAENAMRELYHDLPCEFIATDISVAEIMKYVNNTYHALKIVFGNEIGNICKCLEIDSVKVMEIFCKDKCLNISPYYFKPGFAYGGSCLPKDTRALKTLAGDLYIEVPVINSIDYSNNLQKKRAVEIIAGKGKHSIGFMGLSFKAGTDDLRCSPVVDVIESLIGKGFSIKIYDKNVKLSELTGTNKDFILEKIPHLQGYLYDDLDYVAQTSDVIVIVNREKEFDTILKKYPDKTIVDLVRAWKEVDYQGDYEGISWGNINTNPAQFQEIRSEIAIPEFSFGIMV